MEILRAGDAGSIAARPHGGRLIAGAAILALWPLAKIIGPILILGSNLSAEWKTALIAVLLVGVAKLCLLGAAAVLGRAGFAWVMARVRGRLAPMAPPRQVGRARYRIGLVLFTLPIIQGFLFPFAHDFGAAPPFAPTLAWIADAMLLASLFVLGGAFWEKLRALFVRAALVELGPSPSRRDPGEVRRRERLAAIALAAFGLLGAVAAALVSPADLPPFWRATLGHWLIIVPGLAFLAAAIFAGQAELLQVLMRIKSALPHEIGRARHILGLCLFAGPLVLGLLGPHLFSERTGIARHHLLVAVIAQAVLVASLFLLGGRFWEKLGALFAADATVRDAPPR